MTAKAHKIGAPGQIAGEWARHLESEAVDGFDILPQLLPGTVKEIVEKLVPALHERGIYRTTYQGSTLREHLGLELPS